MRISTILIFTVASVILLARLRCTDNLTVPIYFFIFLYLSQNFIVNSLDYLLFKNYRTYYHDDHFLLSFSYKVYQLAITALLSLLFGWSFVPPFPQILIAPEFLLYMFMASIPMCICMLMSFLFELTAEEPDMRSVIYRTELAKVFFSVLYWYLMTMTFSNWLQSLKKFIVTVGK